jgi:hypothetical protein
MTLNPTTTTFTAILHNQLEQLDRAWARVRAVHADIEHCNNESREYKDAMEALSNAVKALWRLKAAWSDTR